MIGCNLLFSILLLDAEVLIDARAYEAHRHGDLQSVAYEESCPRVLIVGARILKAGLDSQDLSRTSLDSQKAAIGHVIVTDEGCTRAFYLAFTRRHLVDGRSFLSRPHKVDLVVRGVHEHMQCGVLFVPSSEQRSKESDRVIDAAIIDINQRGPASNDAISFTNKWFEKNKLVRCLGQSEELARVLAVIDQILEVGDSLAGLEDFVNLSCRGKLLDQHLVFIHNCKAFLKVA